MSNISEFLCNLLIFLIENFVFIGFFNILICVSFFIFEFLSMYSCGANQLCVRIHKNACVGNVITVCMLLMFIFFYLLLMRFDKYIENGSIESPHVLQETEHRHLHRHRRLLKSG